MRTQALTDLLEQLDSDTAKHIEKLELYKEMLEELDQEHLVSYDETLDMIDSLEHIRGVINE